MVKKLYKHEFAAYLRVWIPMQIILIAVAFFGRILRFLEIDSNIYSIIYVFSIVIYVVAAIASLGLTLVFGVVRFYKNLFSGEGYLSFTLPVTTAQHLNVKLFTAGVFNLFTGISVLVSVLIMTSGKILSDAVNIFGKMIKTGYTYAGANMTFYILEVLALIIVAAFTQCPLYYACIALGQLFRKNRVIGAVVVYFIYYAITQVVSTIVIIIITVASQFRAFDGISRFAANHPLGMVHIYLCGMLVLQLVLTGIYYAVTHRVICKKLNLE